MTDAPPGRLVLIGTGHVFAIQDAVRDAILALRPDVVFVELDAGRLRALLQRRRDGGTPPAGKWLHRRLQRFQEGIAEAYGAEAGGEMLAAVEGANLVGAQTHLVDRRVEVTLKRVLKQLSWLERARALATMVESAVRGLFTGRRGAKQDVEDELARYSNDPDKALMELGRRFPTVRRVVIDERDDFMARRIRTGLAGIGLGIAVIGDGHVPGLMQRLHDIDITPYRLPDVRAGNLPRPEGTTRSVSFGFRVDPDGRPGAPEPPDE